MMTNQSELATDPAAPDPDGGRDAPSPDRLMAALRASEARRQEEQRHFRNVLAVIRAMVRRTADEADTVEDYCGRLDGRLAAYIHTQVLVARDGEVDLETMLADELLRFGLRLGEQVDLAGPPAMVAGHAAGLLALAFHDLAAELVTTGGVDGAGGGLAVRWACSADGALTIEWETPRGTATGEGSGWRWSSWLHEALRHQLSIEPTEREVGDRTVLLMRLPAERVRVCSPEAVPTPGRHPPSRSVIGST